MFPKKGMPLGPGIVDFRRFRNRTRGPPQANMTSARSNRVNNMVRLGARTTTRSQKPFPRKTRVLPCSFVGSFVSVSESRTGPVEW